MVFEHDELLVLVLHVFLLLSVSELELTKLFLLLAQLFVEFCDLLIVVAFLVKCLQGLLLLSLDLEETLILVLHTL